jgi:hypothetical protein
MGVWDWEGSRRCWEGGRDSGNGHGNEKLAAVAMLVPIVADGGSVPGAPSRQHRRRSRTQAYPLSPPQTCAWVKTTSEEVRRLVIKPVLSAVWAFMVVTSESRSRMQLL